MTKRLALTGFFLTLVFGASSHAEDPLPFPEGIWVGDYTCRGQIMPLMIEFDTPDKPSSVAYLVKRKKNPKRPAKFHANVERTVNKRGEDILHFKTQILAE